MILALQLELAENLGSSTVPKESTPPNTYFKYGQERGYSSVEEHLTANMAKREMDREGTLEGKAGTLEEADKVLVPERRTEVTN